jgi:hypothetical protein
MTKREQRKWNNRRDLVVDVIVCCIATLVVVGAVVLVWRLGGGSWFEQLLLNVIGYIGVLISLAGVLLAYLIFRRQKRDGEDTDKYQQEVLADLKLVLAGVDAKVSGLVLQQASDQVLDDDAEQTAGVEDLWDSFKPVSDDNAVYLKSPSGKQRRVYEPDSIPLAVVGALVKTWDANGLRGRWTLGTLRGAFRAEGKGNHPWYLVFVPPAESGPPIIWKVTRGPGGTDHASPVEDNQEFK